MPPLQNVCVVTTFYTLVGILSILFSGVALDIITCRPFMVDEELLVGLNKVKHLIRHTHDARMPPSPTGEGFYFPFKISIASAKQST